MVDKFGNKLVTLPEDTGSFYKRTAINSNFDLDIVLPFKKKLRFFGGNVLRCL